MWDLISPTRDQTYIPCFRRWILKHWTTREVPAWFFFFKSIKWEHKSYTWLQLSELGWWCVGPWPILNRNLWDGKKVWILQGFFLKFMLHFHMNASELSFNCPRNFSSPSLFLEPHSYTPTKGRESPLFSSLQPAAYKEPFDQWVISLCSFPQTP